MCSFYTGDSGRAEREFTEGIALAESIGELRVASLLKGNFAVLQADKANNYRTEVVCGSARSTSKCYSPPANARRLKPNPTMPWQNAIWRRSIWLVIGSLSPTANPRASPERRSVWRS